MRSSSRIGLLSIILFLSGALFFIAAVKHESIGSPLFGDVPDEHWALDAVASLAAKGLVEGYPDGTFKGDRSSTRYEMAMVVARFLAKNEAEHATFGTKSELGEMRKLAAQFRDELDALGIRVSNLEESVGRLDTRVTEKERITFEGDFSAKCVGIDIKNSGRGDTSWGVDVGMPQAVNFNRLHKLGTIDLLNGRPFVNGVGYTGRMRLGVKAHITDSLSAGLRLAGYTSTGNPYIDAYWGIPAPYLSNHFAGNSPVAGRMEGMHNAPWTRLTLDNFVVTHQKSGSKVILGSISETNMDNFILSKVPNPNIYGKSMARFSEKIITDKSREEVSTLRYHEDEETYLPFYGIQVSGRTKIFSPMEWEIMGSKLPFGANPTAGAGQPGTNDIANPLFYSFNGKWSLGERGTFRLNILRAFEDTVNWGSNIPNHGNYWFWTDPLSYSETPAAQRPMRGNTFISMQRQTSYGAAFSYRFEPGGFRTVIAYGGSDYKPNRESGYSAKGNHFRAGLGWTSRANTLRLNAEYLSTDPYYDPFQLYFQPLGEMLLGGVPPGTPIAFSVVPMYYGGFPGSYAPFGYQLHDSGLYPNNREGLRFGGEYRFPGERGALNVRYVQMDQHTPSIPNQTTTGEMSGLPPGFIDPVFHPLRADGVTVLETPRGREYQAGGSISYEFSPGKLKANVQYDIFSFMRGTDFTPDTFTAKRNFVDLRYNVLCVGLEFPTGRNFTLLGGYDSITVGGYHPAINALIDKNAGERVIDVRQSSPHLGFEYDVAQNVNWKLKGRLINTIDYDADAVSPESFYGTQFLSEFNVKF